MSAVADVLAAIEVAQVTERVAEIVAERVIVEGALYTPREAASRLGFQRWRTIYEIADEELPPVPTGPGGGTLMYRGDDLLAYIASRRRGQS